MRWIINGLRKWFKKANTRIRERKYKSSEGTKSYYEISWYKDGKQYKKGGFKSKIDAQIALSGVVTDTSSDIKFGVLAQNYIDRHCALNCKETTKNLYQSYLNNYLSAIYNKFIKDIKKRDVEYIILQLKENQLTHKTINCVIGFIQAIFNYGIDNEYITINPVKTLKKLPIMKPPIHFLNEVQMKVFIELAKESKNEISHIKN